MIKRFFIWLIRQYQRHLSPHLGHHCRFTPTCSTLMDLGFSKLFSIQTSFNTLGSLHR